MSVVVTIEMSEPKKSAWLTFTGWVRANPISFTAVVLTALLLITAIVILSLIPLFFFVPGQTSPITTSSIPLEDNFPVPTLSYSVQNGGTGQFMISDNGNLLLEPVLSPDWDNNSSRFLFVPVDVANSLAPVYVILSQDQQFALQAISSTEVSFVTNSPNSTAQRWTFTSLNGNSTASIQNIFSNTMQLSLAVSGNPPPLPPFILVAQNLTDPNQQWHVDDIPLPVGPPASFFPNDGAAFTIRQGANFIVDNGNNVELDTSATNWFFHFVQNVPSDPFEQIYRITVGSLAINTFPFNPPSGYQSVNLQTSNPQDTTQQFVVTWIAGDANAIGGGTFRLSTRLPINGPTSQSWQPDGTDPTAVIQLHPNNQSLTAQQWIIEPP